MTSYHVSVLYNTSIGLGCPNNDAQQFDKCRLQVSTKHALFELLQQLYSIQYIKWNVWMMVNLCNFQKDTNWDQHDANPGADPGFEKGDFNLVLKSDTGGATNNDF